VGSEETEPNAGWPYDKFLGALAEKPDMTPADFSKIIVDSYLESYDNGADSEPVTFSAINPEKMAGVLTAVDKLALALKKNVSDHDTFYKILKITYDVQQFYYPTYKDLYDLAKLLNERIDVEEIKDSAQAVMDILQPGDDEFIIASGNLTKSMSGAHGVSIYFPVREIYLKYYSKLDFAKKSKWDEFVKAYQKEYDKP
jgi:hypothetical protein